MNWKEFYNFALENYNRGGDGIVECWEEADFDDYVERFGTMTKDEALSMFETWRSYCSDIRSEIF